MGWASEQVTGSPTRKAVLLALANCANHHTGRCDPSIERLCAETELGATAVKTALTQLVADGLLSRERKRRADGSLGTYQYAFPQSRGDQPQTRGDSGLEPRGDSQNQEVLNQDGTTASAVVPLARTKRDITEAVVTSLPGPERVWKVDRKAVLWKHADLARQVLAAWNELTGQDLRSRDWLAKIVMRIREYPEATLQDHRFIIECNLAHPWWKGAATPSVIYGNGAQFERAIQTARAQGATTNSDRLAQIVNAVIERRTA